MFTSLMKQTKQHKTKMCYIIQMCVIAWGKRQHIAPPVQTHCCIIQTIESRSFTPAIFFFFFWFLWFLWSSLSAAGWQWGRPLKINARYHWLCANACRSFIGVPCIIKVRVYFITPARRNPAFIWYISQAENVIRWLLFISWFHCDIEVTERL